MNILVLNGSPRPKETYELHQGDFLDYLGLEDMGVVAAAGIYAPYH